MSYSLTHNNTLRLVSEAEHCFKLDDEGRLTDVSSFLRHHKLPYFVLGGGSNVVLPRHYRGVVILNRLCGIYVQRVVNNFVYVEAQSGITWDFFVAYTVQHGYFGLENLSLIPGTVGAAPVQNIGAYGVQVSDVIDCVYVYDVESAKQLCLSNQECKFGYRNSILKTNKSFIVTSVVFKLSTLFYANVTYPDLIKLDKANLSAELIRNTVIQVRNSKLPNPEFVGNVGSFFHNPVVDAMLAKQLKDKYADIPMHFVDGMYKLSAGWLIDHAGMRGLRDRSVGVYEQHSLVLVNYGTDTTSEEILSFASIIIKNISNMFGITLTIEPEII